MRSRPAPLSHIDTLTLAYLNGFQDRLAHPYRSWYGFSEKEERVHVGSLFSGVGGIDLGLERAGWTVTFQAEADEFRRAVLAERFPGVSCYEDVRHVTDQHPVDLVAGGFPCQDLSVAGRRRGLDGERSGLFFEFARIADTVRPRALLIENVSGLLTSNGGRDFGVLLGTLADLGYGVAWRVLDSRFFGVPQRRRRVFIVGVLSDGRLGAERAGEVLSVGAGCSGHSQKGREAGEIASALTRNGVGAGGGPDDNAAQAGHLVSPTLTAVMKNNAGAGVRRLMPVECERLQGFPDGWTDIEWNGKPAADSRRYAAMGDAVTVNVAEWIGTRMLSALA